MLVSLEGPGEISLLRHTYKYLMYFVFKAQ